MSRTTEHLDPFEKLTPPAGGLNKLRERLTDDRSLYPGWIIGGVLTATILAGAVGLSLQEVAMPPSAFESHLLSQLERYEQAEAILVVGPDRDIASLSVATSNPNVVFYWLEF